MALIQPAVAQAVAHDLAAKLRTESSVRRIWVWSQHGVVEPDRDYVELWLLIDTDDEQTNDRISVAAASLHELYPEINIAVYRLTPAVLEGHAPEEAMRTDADEIVLGVP